MSVFNGEIQPAWKDKGRLSWGDDISAENYGIKDWEGKWVETIGKACANILKWEEPELEVNGLK